MGLPVPQSYADLKPLLELSGMSGLDWWKFLHGQAPSLILDEETADALLLAGIHQTARNFIRYKGHPGLCIGYPFLYIRTPEGFLATPIYLWPVALEPQIQGARRWFLKNRPAAPYLNPWLLSETARAMAPVSLPSTFPERPQLDSIAALLGHSVENTPTEALDYLQAAPDLNQLGSWEEGWRIHPSATLDVFDIEDPEAAGIDFPVSGDTNGSAWAYPLTWSALYPDQEYALSGMSNHQQLLLIGENGSGKTHLAVQAALAALDHGKPSLFVAPSLPILQQVYHELIRQQAAEFTFLIRDAEEDTSRWWGTRPAPLPGKTSRVQSRKKESTHSLDHLQLLRKNQDIAYESLHTPVFGHYTWPNVAGRYLALRTQAPKDLLAAQVTPAEFTFGYEEYATYSAQLQEAQSLFVSAQWLDHPLGGLHPRFFLDFSASMGESEANQQLAAFERRVAALLQRYTTGISFYGDSLRLHLERESTQLRLQLENLKDTLREKNQRFGENWINQWTGPQWLGVLSTSIRQREEAAAELQRQFDLLQELQQRLHAFGLPFSGTESPFSIRQLPVYIKTLDEKMAAWQAAFPDYIQSEIMRMSSQHAQPDIIPPDVAEGLESAMDSLIGELNRWCLPGLKVEHQLLTIPKRQKLLAELHDSLSVLRANMRDYAPFYPWQRFWLPLPGALKKTIRILARLHPSDWRATFQSWYLDQVLLRTQSPELPDGRLRAERHGIPHPSTQSEWQELRSLRWAVQRSQAMQSYKIKEGTPVSALYRQHPDFALQRFPIVLVLASTASALFQGLEPALFQHLFFMEAAGTTWREAAAIAPLGKQISVCTRPFPLAGYPAGSLAWYAQAQQWPTRFLEFIHRWYPQHPAQLNRGTRITEVAAAQPVRTILHNVSVNGALTMQTNQAEAEAILAYLNTALPAQYPTFPQVSIVAFTWEQKHLLSHLLLQQKRGPAEDAERIEQLERSGLGVYHLSEVAGLTSDVCLVSGTLRQFPVEWLGEKEAPPLFRHLYQLAGLGFLSQHLFNSLSFSELEKQAASDSIVPATYWANYLLLLHPRFAQQTDILERRFDPWYPPATPPGSESDLLSFIGTAIRPYLENTPILQHAKTGHLELPLFIPQCPPNGKPVCIVPDGFLWQGPKTSYWWEAQTLEELAAHGIRCIPTWTIRWWQHPDQEARRLAAQILSTDS